MGTPRSPEVSGRRQPTGVLRPVQKVDMIGIADAGAETIMSRLLVNQCLRFNRRCTI